MEFKVFNFRNSSIIRLKTENLFRFDNTLNASRDVNMWKTVSKYSCTMYDSFAISDDSKTIFGVKTFHKL
jgi:hypothetical protein